MGTSALRPTPGQTVGPFYGFALPFDGDNHLAPPAAAGAVRLHGTVFDGLGVPVPDALLEVWQAGEDGSAPRATGTFDRDGATFTGFGRCGTDRAGGYRFWTREPARADGGAPFFAVTVFARGLMHRLLTRAYLPAPGGDLPSDALLSTLAPDRARTLVCEREADGSLRFDVHLQGEGETVFLEHAAPHRHTAR
ncbi:protocatechuate 3,4-dioxygenase subunit alpha [Kineococcus sp. SYSU DK018]|uniref:protocatechuate 3,4-dioxygenase subunit alpha n=1 Tax=Kineococcus sp. SYSU DK018 TaxID=3383139 RepID=UPI003D7D3813